ncbi:MAG TPA: YigZ family protein [Bacteroidales bacterium]|nr:YigZ family protein [Bacteroidales bacterium]
MSYQTTKYLSIVKPESGLYKEKGSKFISFAYPVASETEIKDQIDLLKKEYFDARHHCYAWILGPDKSHYRTNDDGEPSGTAGKPIYNQLLSKDLTNILIVVIRYFGGIKLGVPGLINAYKLATLDVLEKADIREFLIPSYVVIDFNYSTMSEVMKSIKKVDATIHLTEYLQECRVGTD